MQFFIAVMSVRFHFLCDTDSKKGTVGLFCVPIHKKKKEEKKNSNTFSFSFFTFGQVCKRNVGNCVGRQGLHSGGLSTCGNSGKRLTESLFPGGSSPMTK